MLLLRRLVVIAVLASLLAFPSCAEDKLAPPATNTSALDKLRRLSESGNTQTLLSIDGGIGPTTVSAAAEAGARMFVVGSAIFDSNDYVQAIQHLTELAECADRSSSGFVSSSREN